MSRRKKTWYRRRMMPAIGHYIPKKEAVFAMPSTNILMIVADQLRYDCIGYANDYPVSTPNIDGLASEGIWFERAYTPIAVCCPSRQAMLTGLRPERFGVLCNYDFMRARALEPTEWTWTARLAELGYQMGFAGKWQAHPKYDATHYGFADYVGLGGYGPYRSSACNQAPPSCSWDGCTDEVDVEHTRTHWLARNAVDLMNKYCAAGRPWHLRVDFPEPHLPCCPAERFARMYQPDAVPRWRSFGDDFKGKPFIQLQQLYSWSIENRTWEDWAPTVARYYAMVSQVDDAVGLILDALDASGQSEDTLVIFTADHGDLCGGHRMMDKHYVMYEDIVKVPFVVRWPRVVRRGARTRCFVSSSLDIAPTVMEISGCDIPKSDGRSLLPLLRGEEPDDWRTDVVTTYNGQQFGLFSQRMLRNERWKFVWNATDVDELYDMHEDPDELVNLALDPSKADVLEAMRTTLYHRLVECDDIMVANGNPWMKTQLLHGRKAPVTR